MKKEFSTQWVASKQPRKQRKYLANAPNHIRRKFMSANLAKELRGKYGRNIEVRKNDEVKIMRGKFAGKHGKISAVDVKKSRVAVEGVQRSKKDGTKINVWTHASKLKIISLYLDDKRRFNTETKVTEEKNAHKKN